MINIKVTRVRSFSQLSSSLPGVFINLFLEQLSTWVDGDLYLPAQCRYTSFSSRPKVWLLARFHSRGHFVD